MVVVNGSAIFVFGSSIGTEEEREMQGVFVSLFSPT